MSLLSFFERIKRDGFVCGFGWRPKTIEPAKNFYEPPLSNSFPNLKPPEIGCIAKSILKDLENEENWTLSYEDGLRFFTFKTPLKSYSIIASFFEYFILEGLKEFKFTTDERSALYNSLSELEIIKNKKELEIKLKADREILEKLFPECAGKI